jgi:hypothetical protein
VVRVVVTVMDRVAAVMAMTHVLVVTTRARVGLEPAVPLVTVPRRAAVQLVLGRTIDVVRVLSAP